MKHTTYYPFYPYGERVWNINTKVSGIRTDILRAMLKQLTTMLNSHRKVFVFRFDLHTAIYTETNELITNFNRQLFKRIKSRYKINRIGFCWAREQEKSKQQHYHYVLMLDGSKVNSCFVLQKWVKEIWGFNEGSVHWAGYHNLSRQDEEGIQKACYHISYLAKARGKGYRPLQTKDYSTSRIK